MFAPAQLSTTGMSSGLATRVILSSVFLCSLLNEAFPATQTKMRQDVNDELESVDGNGRGLI
jgi:hypothetical protein